MSKLDLSGAKTGLVDAGIEIYRVLDGVIEVAERVRLHLMDSGVRVQLAPQPNVRFTVRAQRSENHSLPPAAQFERVRAATGPTAIAGGWTEIDASPKDVLDPVDNSRILDVWFEIMYAKKVTTVPEAVDAVRWALAVEKYIQG